MNDKYYIIKDDALPEVMHKVLLAQELLRSDKAKTIKQATEMAGISRSVYYKYQDAIEPFFEHTIEQTITISFGLKHTPGILSNVLNIIASYDINVLTINQTIPLNNIANVMITMETHPQSKDLNTLLDTLKELKGMQHLKIIGRSR